MEEIVDISEQNIAKSNKHIEKVDSQTENTLTACHPDDSQEGALLYGWTLLNHIKKINF